MQIIDYNFDDWFDLLKQSPDAFEAKRKEVINLLIVSKPNNQVRLRAMQFSIDSRRLRFKSPLNSCIWISSKMMQSYTQLQTELNRCSTNSTAKQKLSSAEIINFPMSLSTKQKLQYSDD